MYILLQLQLPANNTIFMAVIIFVHAIKNIYLYETCLTCLSAIFVKLFMAVLYSEESLVSVLSVSHPHTYFISLETHWNLVNFRSCFKQIQFIKYWTAKKLYTCVIITTEVKCLKVVEEKVYKYLFS